MSDPSDTDDEPTADTNREVRHSNPSPDPDRGTTDTDHGTTDTGPTGTDAERPETVTDTNATAGDRARTDSDRNASATGRDPGEPGRGEGATPASLDVLKWLSGIVALVGAWIAVSPLVYGAEQAALWNNLAVGAAIFGLAGYNFYRMADEYAPDFGESALVVLLGLWSIVAPFLLAFGSEPLTWSTMASGVAVAVLAGYTAYEHRRTEADATVGSRA